MKTLILKVVSAAAVFLSSASAQAAWQEAKSEHFTVVGDMSTEELRKRTQELEQYDSMLRYLLGTEKTEPVTVFVVSSIGEVQSVLGSGASSRGVAGFYNASAQRSFAVVPERLDFYREGFSPKVILLHEYAHHMLLSGTSVFMPGWAQEGLAEMFATAKLNDDGSVTIGEMNEARREGMLTQSRWSVEEMLNSDLNPPKDPWESIEKYTRGWTLAHYLWMSGERPGQYVEFIKELNRTVDPVAAGKKVFGDLKKLDRELDRYFRFHRFNLSNFSKEQLKTPSDIKVRQLTAGEADMLKFRLASVSGVTEETAGPLAAKARPVADQYPNDLAVQVAMAEIEYDAKNNDLAEAAADRALAIDPKNLYAMVYKGRVAVRRAVEVRDQPEKAKPWIEAGRNWLRKANRIDPEHALPFAVYYDSYGAMGEPAPDDAVAGLFKATTIVPQDSELRVRSAIELIRHDEPDLALSMIAPAAFQAEGSGENKPLKFVREMQETKDKEKLLAKAKELKLDQINEFVPQDDDEDEKDGSKA